MTRIFIGIFFLLLKTNIVFAQDLFEGPFADRRTNRIARKNTNLQLDSLSKVLDLKPRDTRARNFALTVCPGNSILNVGSTTWTPAGRFPLISGCPGILAYYYEQKRNGSHYTIRFFYNDQGEIIDKEITYTVVIY